MFNAQIERRSLETLDPKKTVTFLKNKLPYDESLAIPHKLGKYDIVWTIEDFLSEEECDKLIEVCEETGFDTIDHLYEKEYRDSVRLLAFDENGLLVKTIEERLKNDYFLDRLNKKKWKSPYGLNADKYKWNDNNGKINPCLRFNKYPDGSKGFGWHRDAQYTQNNNIRSNYTIVIYLTENEGGNIHFIAPKKKFIHNGLTTKEEMKNLKSGHALEISPQKGMAVIFDQRLLHKADSCEDEKYVLRTDLLCYGELDEDAETTELEKKVWNLAKRLFRQAQYYELTGKKTNINKAQRLYDICLSLRQHPHMINKYPANLEKLLVNIPEGKKVYNLRLVSRSGEKYVFQFENNKSPDEIYTCVKIASAFTILSSVRAIDKYLMYDIDPFMQKMLRKMGISVDLNKKVNSKDEKNEKNYSDEDDDEDDEEDEEDYSEEDEEKWNDFEDYMNDYVGKYDPDYEGDPDDYEEYEGHFEDFLKERYGKCMDISLNDRESKAEKGFTGLVLSANRDELYTRCEGCRLCDDDCYDLDHRYTAYSDDKLEFKLGNFEMEIENIKETENGITGKVVIGAPSTSFNHASCNCDQVIGDVKSDKVYWHVTMETEFEVDLEESTIEITFVPGVVM